MPNDIAPPEFGAQPDAAAWVQMQSSRDAMLASIDELFKDDKAGAEREKAAYRQKHAAILSQHSISAPVARTADQIAEDNFEAAWNAMPIGENLAAELEAEIERIDALPQSERDYLVRELVKQHGDDGYQRLLAEAKAGLQPGQEFTASMMASRHFLALASAYGRQSQAYDRARAAFDARRK